MDHGHDSQSEVIAPWYMSAAFTSISVKYW